MRNIQRRHTPYTKFKAFLDEIGLSQQKLAEILDKSASAVNQNLNGTGGDFSLSEIRVICSMFKISSDDYFLHPEVSKMKHNDTA